MSKIADKLFGTHSQRELKRIKSTVDKIESMRDEMMALSDDELRAKTPYFKKRLADGETLDDILPERQREGRSTWSPSASSSSAASSFTRAASLR